MREAQHSSDAPPRDASIGIYSYGMWLIYIPYTKCHILIYFPLSVTSSNHKHTPIINLGESSECLDLRMEWVVVSNDQGTSGTFTPYQQSDIYTLTYQTP